MSEINNESWCEYCRDWTSHSTPEHTKFKQVLSGGPAYDHYDDQYNCEMCRVAKKFCRLHTELNNEGKPYSRRVVRIGRTYAKIGTM